LRPHQLEQGGAQRTAGTTSTNIQTFSESMRAIRRPTARPHVAWSASHLDATTRKPAAADGDHGAAGLRARRRTHTRYDGTMHANQCAAQQRCCDGRLHMQATQFRDERRPHGGIPGTPRHRSDASRPPAHFITHVYKGRGRTRAT
jgi:hypothetical protein